MTDDVANMGTSLADRIAKTIDAAGGFSVVSKGSGISDSQLRRYADGTSEPSASKLGSIAKFCGVTADWLITGAGITTYADGSSKLRDEDMVAVPVLNVLASSGSGLANYDIEVSDWLLVPIRVLSHAGVRPENAHFIRNVGDSNEPTIQNGADVIIDIKKTDIREGGIYAISIGGDLRLKRIRRLIDGRIVLVSDNKVLYPDEIIDRSEAENLHIHGRVAWTERFL